MSPGSCGLLTVGPEMEPVIKKADRRDYGFPNDRPGAKIVRNALDRSFGIETSLF
jgi:hypothetical protein